MWVWDNDEKDRIKRIVAFIVPEKDHSFPVLSLYTNTDGGYCTEWVRHCAEIEEEPEVILSMQEIADKFGVSIEKLKIKK